LFRREEEEGDNRELIHSSKGIFSHKFATKKYMYNKSCSRNYNGRHKKELKANRKTLFS